jgi:dethiobiotin synthase
MPNKKRKIFIAATGQNVGKTTVSIGLFHKLRTLGYDTGFIKPVGQRYVTVGKLKVDEDSYLVYNTYPTKCPLKDMNPIAVPRGFTTDYINHPHPSDIKKKIKKSYKKVNEYSKFTVIEGTGHAGVGSVFDTSNAVVAKLLRSKVVIVSTGGIGKAIDEVMLSVNLFKKYNVEVMGVIINKVLEEKYERIKETVNKGLRRLGTRVLGVVPYKRRLSSPNMLQICNVTGGEFIACKEKQFNTIEHIIVGGMTVRNVLPRLGKDTLIITPADREDVIFSIINYNLFGSSKNKSVAGILIAGSVKLHRALMPLLKQSTVPIILCKYDTYDSASVVHDLTVKIQTNDEEKIKLSQDLVNTYVNTNYILENS